MFQHTHKNCLPYTESHNCYKHTDKTSHTCIHKNSKLTQLPSFPTPIHTPVIVTASALITLNCVILLAQLFVTPSHGTPHPGVVRSAYTHTTRKHSYIHIHSIGGASHATTGRVGACSGGGLCLCMIVFVGIHAQEGNKYTCQQNGMHASRGKGEGYASCMHASGGICKLYAC